MAVTYGDQVTWKELHLAGSAYVFGDLLPAASTTADIATRSYLRSSGAIRSVTIAGASGDLAALFLAEGNIGAAREAGVLGAAAPKAIVNSPDGTVVLNY